ARRRRGSLPAAPRDAGHRPGRFVPQNDPRVRMTTPSVYTRGAPRQPAAPPPPPAGASPPTQRVGRARQVRLRRRQDPSTARAVLAARPLQHPPLPRPPRTAAALRSPTRGGLFFDDPGR